MTAYRGELIFLLEPLSENRTRFRQIERFNGLMVLFVDSMIKNRSGYKTPDPVIGILVFSSLSFSPLPSSRPRVMIEPDTAPHTSCLRAIPAPKPSAIFNARSFEIPVMRLF